MEDRIKELLESSNYDDISLGLNILKAQGYNDFKELGKFYSDNFMDRFVGKDYNISIGEMRTLAKLWWGHFKVGEKGSRGENYFADWKE